MPETPPTDRPITLRKDEFDGQEALLFNHAVTLVTAHGRQEAMYADGHGYGEIANAAIGGFRIERIVMAQDAVNRKVQIRIARGGQPVFEAMFAQEDHPTREGESMIACTLGNFVRGDWEADFLKLH